MTDVKLQVPAQGKEIRISSQADSIYVLKFSPSDAFLTRVGTDMVFAFEESGSQIVLSDFYAQFSSDKLPDFIVDNQDTEGFQFFSAFGEDLMPAAGPTGADSATDGAGGPSSVLNADMVGGVDRLGGLDTSSPGATACPVHEPAGAVADAGGGATDGVA